MKNKFKILMTIVTILYCCTDIAHSQNKAEREQVNMITKFYTALNTVCSDNQKNQHVVKSACDSVITKYCTQGIRQEAMQWLDAKGESVSNYWKMDKESLKTMKIVKDTIDSNMYLVSYYTNMSNSKSNSDKQKVNLKITVKKEGKNYKIDGVR